MGFRLSSFRVVGSRLLGLSGLDVRVLGHGVLGVRCLGCGDSSTSRPHRRSLAQIPVISGSFHSEAMLGSLGRSGRAPSLMSTHSLKPIS